MEPKQNQLYRFKDLAFDVAQNFGNTTQQSQDKAARMLNRAAVRVAGNNRRWTWLMIKDSFHTSQGIEEYSLNQDVAVTQMFWMEGSNRQKLDRIPSARFRELVPNSTEDSGNPRLYDFAGVDSSGCKVVTLWPIPGGDLEIFYRYRRFILPIQDKEANVWGRWGMPPNVMECLIEYATALMFKGVDDRRHNEQLGQAEAMVLDAYAADQENLDTTQRIPFDHDQFYNDEPVFEARFGV